MIGTPFQFYSGDKTRDWPDMWRVCERGEVHAVFWWGYPMEICHLKDLRVGGRIILKGIFKNWFGLVDKIDLAQVRERERALLNAVLNLRVP